MATKKTTKSDKSGAKAAPVAGKASKPAGYMPRLQQRYLAEVRSRLMAEYGLTNPMAVPRIEKVVLNMGLGEASRNIKILDSAVRELAAIAGQQPVTTRARKSIANFKLREGVPIGCRVTLRRDTMWHFLDRLISVALPRVRDFRGVSARSFDGRGSYTLGVRDHFIFPEVDHTKGEGAKGLNVTIVTSASTDDQARFLLRELGMPFA